MPEGPEIALIANCLDGKIRKETIDNVVIWTDSRYYKDEDRSTKFNVLHEKTIKEVSFKGKKIIFSFKDDTYMVSSLGLEGRWRIIDVFNPEVKHVSAIFYLKSGKILQFQDQRHFGEIKYYDNLASMDEVFEKSVGNPWIPSSMYPDIVTKDEFFNYLSNKKLYRKSIMMFLVDQKYTAGIGNYIRSDALYLAKISPHRLINSLTRKESDQIYNAAIKIMDKAMRDGGHTLSTYFTPIGDTGGYVPYVYGRKLSHPKGEEIAREFDSQKRSIFWVPLVQV